MRTPRRPAFDHGAALRTPPAHDTRSWTKLWLWLGDASVRTPHGWTTARPGDWIILSVSGHFHVAAGRQLGEGLP